MSDNTPSAEQAIRALIRAELSKLNLPRIGRVETYSQDTQKVSVKPVVKEAYEGEEGDRTLESMPVITDVPVLFFGSSTSHNTFPIAAGTYGLIVFLGVSIDKWLATGTNDQDPEDDRSGALSDAVFIPGVRPFSGALAAGDVSASHTLVGTNGVDHQFAALANLCNTRFARLEGARYKVDTSVGVYLTSTMLAGSAGYNAAHPAASVPNPPALPAEVNYGDSPPAVYSNGHQHVNGQSVGVHAACAGDIATVPASPVGVGSATVKITE